MWKVLSLYKQAHLKLCESWSLTANQQISYLALLVMVTDTIIFPKSFVVPYASNSSKLSFITNSSPQWTDACCPCTQHLLTGPVISLSDYYCDT